VEEEGAGGEYILIGGNPSDSRELFRLGVGEWLLNILMGGNPSDSSELCRLGGTGNGGKG
jgi:hypothetical protein